MTRSWRSSRSHTDRDCSVNRQRASRDIDLPAGKESPVSQLNLQYGWHNKMLYSLTLLVGRHEEHPACKELVVLVCWWWRFDRNFARLIAPVVTTQHPIILSSNKIQNWYIVGYASGCVVECRICNREVAGSNLGRGHLAPMSTQPSIPQGSVNEYQLRLGRQRQVWLILIAEERCADKTVKSLENTCHTWALLRWWFTTKRR